MFDNDGSTGQLTAKQEIFIQALLAGNNQKTSAKAAGISDKTAERWLRLQHIQAAYRAARKQVFDETMSSLALKAQTWVDRLDHHTSHEDTPPAIQVRALQLLLEMATSHVQTAELEARLAALEAQDRADNE